MLWAQIILALASLLVCSFAPGYLAVRGLRWRPLEKICGAIALSLILIYLVAFGAFAFAAGAETAVFRGYACIAAGLFVWQWKSIRRLALSFGARQALMGLGFLLVWSVPPLAMIRVYSGAGWGGDWNEHFQRALFFLHHLPTDIQITGGYLLPARPPMMNLIGAFFLGEVTDLFEIHQALYTAMNLFAFLPCCLLLHALVVKNRGARWLPLTVLFALNPMLMENAWYPWTKLLAVFYVLFALWLYLAGLRKNDGVRIVAAFVCLAAGMLVHYSAGPYVVFLAGHYLLRVFWTRPNRIRELAAIGVTSGLLMLTWFGWSYKAYGLHTTLSSNTSVSASQKYAGSTGVKIVGNLFNSVVPAILRDPESLSMFNQPNKWGELRDNAFVIYQTTLVFGMGLVGGPLVLWLLFVHLRKGGGRISERNFWLAFIPVVILLGIAVVGEPDLMGVAHLTLMPLVTLGVTLIAASFPWGRFVTVLLIAGCVVDFAFGIYLHARVQNFENTPGRTIFSGLTMQNNQVIPGGQGPDTLGGASWLNWVWKSRDKIMHEWLQELGALPQSPGIRNLEANLEGGLRANERNFGGWYRLHGGEISMIGDHLGASEAAANTASALMIVLFAGLLVVLWREASASPAAVPELAGAHQATRKKQAARKR